MNNQKHRLARIVFYFATLMILACSAPWVGAQSELSEPFARPLPPTTSLLYQFVYDGLTPSGFSHGDILYDELIQGSDGNFYGTTYQGGSGTCMGPFGVIGCGTIFKITKSGTLTVLHNFTYDSTTNTAVNGIYPYGGLVQGRDGSFYGTTSAGGEATAVCNGTLGCGVIFRITPAGKYTVLHTFKGVSGTPAEGGGPIGRLILGRDGNFYGTTSQGGYTLDKVANQGTIFEVTAGGGFATLVSFEGDFNGFADPAHPYAGLIQGKDGNFYGTSQFGGTSGAGTVFKYAGGKVTVLHSFVEQAGQVFPDGAYPKGALVQASGGNLFGTTSFGGALTTFYQSGTLFRITTNGAFTKLWDFNATDALVNGVSPCGGLIQASDGKFYGTTTAGGGAANSGTIYQLTPAGAVSQVLSFDASTIGALPEAVPLQAADGTLYITNNGGTVSNNHYQGAIVHVANGLPAPKPVILRFLPASAHVGDKITISGSNFVGTTAVLFNGLSAAFTVKSTTTITATVPTGATSGKITVTNAGGSTASTQIFSVVP